MIGGTSTMRILLGGVLLLPACFLLDVDEENPFELRPCPLGQFQCSPMFLCANVDPDSDKKFCVERDKLGDITAAYQRRKVAKCQKRGGHNLSSTEEIACVDSGIANCERCQKIRKCRDCPAVVPTSTTWFRGRGCPEALPKECWQR